MATLSLSTLLSFGPPTVRLDGRRLFLRPPRSSDWPQWSGLREASRAFLTPWEPQWSTDALTRAAFRRRVRRHTADWRSDQGYSFFAFRQSDAALIGGIGLSNVRRGVAETGSLGYWIGEPFARQGYMTDALALTVEFAFRQLGLHRIEAACLPTNAPSRGLLLKSGFREEGYAAKYLCIDGAWQDHVLFAILREEWRR